MALLGVLTNIRNWVIVGIVCALLIGSWGPDTPTYVLIVLMVQMTLSMDGVTLKPKDIKEYRKTILYSILVVYGVGAGLTLLSGLFFFNSYPEVWQGWAILATVPCAVSSVTMVSLYARGNLKSGIMCVAVTYILSLATAPLISFVLIGDAVSPLEIFKYVVLFLAVPMLINIPLGKVEIDKRIKTITINVMLFLMIVFSLGYNREYIFNEPTLVTLVIIVNIIRIFGASFMMIFLFKKYGKSRDNCIVYIAMGVWRNSGLAMSLCLILLTDSPGAVIPCVVAMVIEMVWFAVVIEYLNKRWPVENTGVTVSNA
jgi:BASS family bile acid:Na+ symporter